MWLVQSFWKLCGLFNVDLTYNKFQNVYSVLLIVTCVYNFITASNALCKLDHWCDVFSTAMIGMYTRVLASTTLLSRIAIMAQSKQSLLKYKETIKAFEIYSPTSSTQHKNYKIFSFAVVFVCLSIILPINISRLYYLYQNESSDVSLLIYYLFIYIQNLSMCCIETQFVTQCFIIYTRFRGINDDLKKLRNENVNYAKYPFILGSSATMWKDYKKSFQCVRYDKDFYRPRLISHPMANAVEILRIKHWLTRQAVDILNNLLGIQMGLSVFLLWVMALFDIYYEIFHNSPSKLLVYGWLFQYSLRLFMIILVAHYTTKQAIKSKSIILDTNNQMLDNSTKEELLLFVNQIRHQSIAFTACDFFTLNTQIIKSVSVNKI
ncbi:uncharacterized protein LOC114128624 [Aphis gossypii]|uniref:uncharacterized protein LOC114128624 n=1 Tax=Aphis gossypii TaxID=80765 RepID=UPI0021593553|nr:uncharacterized protein LOC114128624 [Aphis gossypii]